MRSALGVQAAAQALGVALGPAVGGLLVDTVGWRWVFLVNVPVAMHARLAAMVGAGPAQVIAARARARVNTASSIGSVSTPVLVFCRLGW